MKARFNYLIYSTDRQKNALARLFGSFRTMWSDFLAFCQEIYQKGKNQLSESELQIQKFNYSSSRLSEVQCKPLKPRHRKESKKADG